MTDIQKPIHDEVLEIFNRHRQKSGTPFDESHFLDYLLVSPRGKRSVHKSFRGLRRYNAFIMEIQMHFSVYFSMKDFERNYSLDGFVQRIAELQSSRRSSLASFRSHVSRGFGWNTVVLLSLLGAVAGFILWQHLRVASVMMLIIVIVGNIWALSSYLRWRAYHKALELRLRGNNRE